MTHVHIDRAAHIGNIAANGTFDIMFFFYKEIFDMKRETKNISERLKENYIFH